MVPLSILAAQSVIFSMADQQSRLILMSCLAEETAMMVVRLTAGDCIALQVAAVCTPPAHATDTRLQKVCWSRGTQHWSYNTLTVTAHYGHYGHTELSPADRTDLSRSTNYKHLSSFLSLPSSLAIQNCPLLCLRFPLTVIVGVAWPDVSRGLILLLTDYS